MERIPGVRPWRELASLALAAAAVVYGFFLVPSWEPHAVLTDPSYIATFASGLLILLPAFAKSSKRLFLGLFLAGMPVVYILRAWFFGDAGSIWPEIPGLFVFGIPAWPGYNRSPGYLAVGIAAHGLVWDSWHLHNSYIPSWYASGCLVVDLGIGLYVASNLRALAAR